MQLNLAPDPTANATAPHPAEPAPKSPAANLASPLADAHGLGTLLSLGLGTVRSMDTAPTDAGSESVIDALRNQHLLLTIPSTSRRIIRWLTFA
jgi:hypothetical protein